MADGFETADPSVPGMYRVLEQSAAASPSPVLTIGLVDVERGRAITMALVLGPAGRLLRRRPRTRTGLLVWMHDRDKCWLLAGGGQGRLRGTPELAATANPLLPVRALGADLASGLAAARAAETFTVAPLGSEITGSLRTSGERLEFRFASAEFPWLVHLSPGDEADAALLRRPFPRIITAREVVPVEPIVTDSADVPTWAQARCYLAAAIGE